jgi:hypothetical protein
MNSLHLKLGNLVYKTEYGKILKFNWNIILNWWFPITFNWLRKAIPSEQIQITRTLIYWAVNQIMKSNQSINKFIDLDKWVQEFIKINSD